MLIYTVAASSHLSGVHPHLLTAWNDLPPKFHESIQTHDVWGETPQTECSLQTDPWIFVVRWFSPRKNKSLKHIADGGVRLVMRVTHNNHPVVMVNPLIFLWCSYDFPMICHFDHFSSISRWDVWTGTIQLYPGRIQASLVPGSLGGRLLNEHVIGMDDILATWKLNAFTCFAASSWGERIVEVDACCVQLVFGKHGFDYWYFYLRSCRFGISLMCQFHWELDSVGFSPFDICGCVEMMRGIGGEGFFFFHFRVSPGYRQSIAGNTWVVLPCLVLSLLLLLLLLLLVLLVLLLIYIKLHWLLWLPESAASHVICVSKRRCTDSPDWV